MSGSVEAIMGRQQQPLDPLATISGYADFANKLAQNASIKANTQNALTQNAAIQAGTANTLQQTQNLQTSNQSAQQDLAVRHADRHAQMLEAFSNLPDQKLVGGGVLSQGLQDLIASGQVRDAGAAKTFQSQIDRITASGGAQDGSKYRPLINSLFSATLKQNAPGYLQGQPVQIDNGQTRQGGLQGGLGSANPGAINMTGPAIPVGAPSNAQLAAQRSDAVDTNQYLGDGTTPNPNFGVRTTVPTPIPAQYQGPGAPGTATMHAPVYTAANPPRLNQVSPIAGQPTQGTTLATSLPPGAVAPLEASAAQYSAAQTNASTFAQRISPLQRAQTLSTETPTGPGSEWVNNIKAYLTTGAAQFGLGATDLAKIADVGVSNYQELSKYLTQASTSNPMAGRSDSSLASVFSGSPNTKISQLAVQDTLKTQIALERMNQAAYASYTGQPNQYGSYAAKFASTIDPRAFETDYMTPAQQAAVRASLKTPADRQRFMDSLALAKQTGSFTNNAMPVQTTP